MWYLIKWLHVFAGALWIGGAIIITFFILPSVKAAGPAGRAVMKQIAAVTVVCGVVLYMKRGGVWGMGLNLGAFFGLSAGAFGILVQSRNVRKLSALTGSLQGPPRPDQAASMARLQRKLYLGGFVASALLLLAITGMIS